MMAPGLAIKDALRTRATVLSPERPSYGEKCSLPLLVNTPALSPPRDAVDSACITLPNSSPSWAQ